MSAQSSCNIRNFTEFLENCLQRKVLGFTLKPLTKPGDNYGSTMQSVDVEVAGECESASDKVNIQKSEKFRLSKLDLFTSQKKIVHLVAKSAVTNPYLIEIFQPSLTFVKENHFYSDIIPALEIFQQNSNVPHSQQIDAFIRCPGSRISLNSSKISRKFENQNNQIINR